ncbi:hypothetical protein B0J12DRAFT_353764 [Macrophomina phaseolina]|uniref:Uncharacterized protein n=1 Tax=Macrophomina phaseolina TaxID=35725 RepID=A0ABQ8FUX6_9PEZI|nr:hypothetical protein B0J12DRAFT_353764 [Macrophomina phaseolina]
MRLLVLQVLRPHRQHPQDCLCITWLDGLLKDCPRTGTCRMRAIAGGRRGLFLPLRSQSTRMPFSGFPCTLGMCKVPVGCSGVAAFLAQRRIRLRSSDLDRSTRRKAGADRIVIASSKAPSNGGARTTTSYERGVGEDGTPEGRVATHGAKCLRIKVSEVVWTCAMDEVEWPTLHLMRLRLWNWCHGVQPGGVQRRIRVS